MEIIKQGKLPEESTRVMTCDYCKTKFKFSLKEAERHSDQRDGDYTTINCPLCKKSLYV